MWRFICSLDLVTKFWLKQNFFDKKDFDCNYNPIYPTFFCWLLQFLLLAMIKIKQQALNTIIHFYLCFQTFLCILTITSSRYFVYILPEKMESSTVATQLCLKNGFRLLDSESAPKIPSVPIFSQNGQLWSFQPKFEEIAKLRAIIWF